MALVPLALPVLSLCNTLSASTASGVAELTSQLDEAVEALLSELRTTMGVLSDAQKKEVRMIADDIEDAIDQCVTTARVLSKDPEAEGLLKKVRGTYVELGHLVKDALFEFGQKLSPSSPESDHSEEKNEAENELDRMMDEMGDNGDEGGYMDHDEKSTEGDNALDRLMGEMDQSDEQSDEEGLARELGEMNTGEGVQGDTEDEEGEEGAIDLSDEMFKLLESEDDKPANSSVSMLLESLQNKSQKCVETARGGDFTVAKHEELEDLVDDIIATLRPRLSRMDGNDKRKEFLKVLNDLDDAVQLLIDANKDVARNKESPAHVGEQAEAFEDATHLIRRVLAFPSVLLVDDVYAESEDEDETRIEGNEGEEEGEEGARRPETVPREEEASGRARRAPGAATSAPAAPTKDEDQGNDEYSSGSESPWEDDDEELRAQREEFAKLFGSSLEQMVENKADNEFWTAMDRFEALVAKCTEAAKNQFHAAIFINDTLRTLGAEIARLVRVQADDLAEWPLLQKYRYDLADDVEDVVELYTTATTAMYRAPSAITETNLDVCDVHVSELMEELSNEKERDQIRRGKVKAGTVKESDVAFEEKFTDMAQKAKDSCSLAQKALHGAYRSQLEMLESESESEEEVDYLQAVVETLKQESTMQEKEVGEDTPEAEKREKAAETFREEAQKSELVPSTTQPNTVEVNETPVENEKQAEIEGIKKAAENAPTEVKPTSAEQVVAQEGVRPTEASQRERKEEPPETVEVVTSTSEMTTVEHVKAVEPAPSEPSSPPASPEADATGTRRPLQRRMTIKVSSRAVDRMLDQAVEAPSSHEASSATRSPRKSVVKRDAAVTPTAPNSAENEAEEEKDRKRREEEADIVKRYASAYALKKRQAEELRKAKEAEQKREVEERAAAEKLRAVEKEREEQEKSEQARREAEQQVRAHEEEMKAKETAHLESTADNVKKVSEKLTEEAKKVDDEIRGEGELRESVDRGLEIVSAQGEREPRASAIIHDRAEPSPHHAPSFGMSANSEPLKPLGVAASSTLMAGDRGEGEMEHKLEEARVEPPQTSEATETSSSPRKNVIAEMDEQQSQIEAELAEMRHKVVQELAGVVAPGVEVEETLEEPEKDSVDLQRPSKSYVHARERPSVARMRKSYSTNTVGARIISSAPLKAPPPVSSLPANSSADDELSAAFAALSSPEISAPNSGRSSARNSSYIPHSQSMAAMPTVPVPAPRTHTVVSLDVNPAGRTRLRESHVSLAPPMPALPVANAQPKPTATPVPAQPRLSTFQRRETRLIRRSRTVTSMSSAAVAAREQQKAMENEIRIAAATSPDNEVSGDDMLDQLTADLSAGSPGLDGNRSRASSNRTAPPLEMDELTRLEAEIQTQRDRTAQRLQEELARQMAELDSIEAAFGSPRGGTSARSRSGSVSLDDLDKELEGLTEEEKPKEKKKFRRKVDRSATATPSTKTKRTLKRRSDRSRKDREEMRKARAERAAERLAKAATLNETSSVPPGAEVVELNAVELSPATRRRTFMPHTVTVSTVSTEKRNTRGISIGNSHRAQLAAQSATARANAASVQPRVPPVPLEKPPPIAPEDSLTPKGNMSDRHSRQSSNASDMSSSSATKRPKNKSKGQRKTTRTASDRESQDSSAPTTPKIELKEATGGKAKKPKSMKKASNDALRADVSKAVSPQSSPRKSPKSTPRSPKSPRGSPKTHSPTLSSTDKPNKSDKHRHTIDVELPADKEEHRRVSSSSPQPDGATARRPRPVKADFPVRRTLSSTEGPEQKKEKPKKEPKFGTLRGFGKKAKQAAESLFDADSSSPSAENAKGGMVALTVTVLQGENLGSSDAAMPVVVIRAKSRRGGSKKEKTKERVKSNNPKWKGEQFTFIQPIFPVHVKVVDKAKNIEIGRFDIDAVDIDKLERQTKKWFVWRSADGKEKSRLLIQFYATNMVGGGLSHSDQLKASDSTLALAMTQTLKDLKNDSDGDSADRVAPDGPKKIDIRDIWEEEERQRLKAAAERAKKELEEERARSNPEYNPYI